MSAPKHHYQFNRNQLCLLAGISLEAFKTLRRRRQIQIGWTVNGEPTDMGLVAFDVVCWAIVAALLKVDGKMDAVSPTTANEIVKSHEFEILRVMRDASEDRFIGLADGVPVYGTLKMILEFLAEHERGTTRLYLVNISNIVKEVRNRARETDIPFPSESESRD